MIAKLQHRCRWAAVALAVGVCLAGCQRSESTLVQAAPPDDPTVSTSPQASAESIAPFGIERRIPWTTSRVKGSPEPPQPYRVERTFKNVDIQQPLVVAAEPGTERLLVVQHLGNWAGPGQVSRIKDDPETSTAETLLSVNEIIFGLAFHPDYLHNGFLYLGSNGPVEGPNKTTRVTRYTVDRQPPHHCDPASAKIIIQWPSDGHNGGDLGFGPDGMLYVTSGDGTADSDRFLTGQDISDLLGAVLRIDIEKVAEGQTYSIPPDNPFVDLPGARGELWAYGLRNPWKMTFDRRTGHLWVGNNGQDLWEQVYLVERGGNYGWSIYEGSHPFYLERKRGPTPISRPAVEHSHAEARSLTGGIVYYGATLPELVGAYVYGDWSTGRIWGVRHDGKQVTWHKELAETTLQIGGFSCDHAGELLVIDQGGGLYRLEPTPAESAESRFPTRLSETGLFLSTHDYRPEPALIEYSVNAPVWADGALQQRHLGLPGDVQIDFPAPRGWNCPDGTVVIKTLSLEVPSDDGISKQRTFAERKATMRRIETQMLARQQGQWQAYTYRWNDDQSDAVLVPRDGLDVVCDVADPSTESGRRQQPWRFASRSECMACHSRAANFVLGLCELQINRHHDYGGIRDNQLRTWEHLGLFRVSSLEYEQELHARTLRAGNAVWGALVERAPGVPLARLVSRYVPKEAWSPSAVGHVLRREAARMREKLRAALAQHATHITWLPKRPSEYRRLVDPYDARVDLDSRARSYLHVNCSQCHVEAGGGNALLELEFTTLAAKMHLLDEPPRHATFGLEDARLVASGDPLRSVLLYRMAKLGGGRMPRVGSGTVDEQGLKLLHDWIARLLANAQPGEPLAAQRAQQLAWLNGLIQGAVSSTDERDAAIGGLLATPSGALLVVRAIDDNRLPESERRRVIARGVAHDRVETRDLFERFLPPDQRTARLGSEFDAARLLAVEGDPERGKKLWFENSAVQCKSCHRIGEASELVGPDLAHVGKKLNRAQLLESIVQPSRTIDAKYTSYVLVTQQGQIHSGTLTSRSADEVVLRDARSQGIRVPAVDIESLTEQRISLMPEFALRDLTLQQAADLLSFLESLK